jgi:hypothetical protein
MNVCKKMRLFSTLAVVLVGVAGFEPATPSSRTLGSPKNVRICGHFLVGSSTKNDVSFRFIGGRTVAGPALFFPVAGKGCMRLPP